MTNLKKRTSEMSTRSFFFFFSFFLFKKKRDQFKEGRERGGRGVRFGSCIQKEGVEVQS